MSCLLRKRPADRRLDPFGQPTGLTPLGAEHLDNGEVELRFFGQPHAFDDGR
jgi:hypothetical protein